MRVIFTILFVASFLGSINAQEGKGQVIKKFTEGIVSYEEGELSAYSPISSFNKVALKKAAKAEVLTKDNMLSSIAEAKSYTSCIITVGTHTIVKITNLDKKIMSGSWGCKVPFGEGYTQKGSLTFKQGYINNIIGVPDSQRRMIFFFK